jgi:hypothetical protein
VERDALRPDVVRQHRPVPEGPPELERGLDPQPGRGRHARGAGGSSSAGAIHTFNGRTGMEIGTPWAWGPSSTA